jgi:hypothetical protein
MLDLMSDVALQMTERSQDRVELVEAIAEQDVMRIATARFGSPVPSGLYTTTSFLEPVRRRSGQGMVLQFFHRSFHEYFVAVALQKKGAAGIGYPTPVRELLAELQAEQT